MSSEIELKLDVPAGKLDAIAGRPWLKKLEKGRPKTERLVSVYFDTGNRALKDHHLALRVRHVGDKYLQTVKCGSSAVDREEWEEEILGETPERNLARQTALKPYTSKKKWRKLRPVFETSVERTSLPLRYDGAAVEMALDRGKVTAEGRDEAISEVELELKEGGIDALVDLARRLADSLPVSLNLKSKAERGYALADDDADKPVKASGPAVAAGQNAARGFTTIALSCLQQVTANRAAILKGDPEGVHQMRVGLRRLRTALSLFKDMLPGKQTKQIKKDLKWFSGQLQPARDFDVFVEDGVTKVEQEEQRNAPLENLKEGLAQRRAQGMAQAKKLVSGERYRRIILDTGLWAMAGEWATTSDDMQVARRTRPLPDVAREILKKRTAKVLKKLKRLEEMDAAARHKLRIAAKKLRYGASFFAPLYDHGPTKKEARLFATRLKALQSALGRLNDIQVHEQFAQKQIRKKKTGNVRVRRAYGLGFVTGRERMAVPACIAAAAKAGKRFARHSDYWR